VSVSSLVSSVRLIGPARRMCGPAVGKSLVDLVNEAAEAGEHAAMEVGLHHAPLAAPKIALAGHDAIAEQDPDPVHAWPLVKLRWFDNNTCLMSSGWLIT